MSYAISFLIITAVSWATLMIIVPLSQKLASFSLPTWPETMWKLAVVAVVGNLVALLLVPVSLLLAWIVGAAIFWVFMVKWFDVDLYGAMILVIVSWIVRTLIVAAVFALIIPWLISWLANQSPP